MPIKGENGMCENPSCNHGVSIHGVTFCIMCYVAVTALLSASGFAWFGTPDNPERCKAQNCHHTRSAGKRYCTDHNRKVERLNQERARLDLSLRIGAITEREHERQAAEIFEDLRRIIG